MGELQRRPIELEYQGHIALISFDDDQMVNLTDIWRAAGSPENKNPNDWLRGRHAKGFIDHMAKSLGTGISRILKTIKGESSYAHWQVAVEYSRYLSHRFAEAANHALRQWVEEQYDPGLKMERAIDLYEKLGKDSEWIEERFKGIGSRKDLCKAMQEHNCSPKLDGFNAFAAITDAQSVALFGQTTRERKSEKGISKNGSLRDNYSREELAKTGLSEMLGARRIREKKADGGKSCVEHGIIAARAVAEACAKALS